MHVGEPPLTHLTAWRMTLAADLLHDTDDTIAKSDTTTPSPSNARRRRTR
jgi:hypothetical protein